MDAKDLMIGDWVYAIDDNGEKHPCRVNDLKYDYINKLDDFCVDFYGTEYNPEWPDVAFNVEPIPLTPEILEKNFEKKTFYGIYDDYFDLDIREYSDGLYIVTYHSCEFNIPDQTIHLSWIHELQHFMRHCGIEKEIKLP